MEIKKERVLTATVSEGLEGDDQLKIEELDNLVESAGGEVVCQILQKNSKISAKTYLSSGKLEEIRMAKEDMDCQTLIVNHNLTGSQMRNLESNLDMKVVDRTGLILDIFSQRAYSQEGALQVKLAQLKYRLPRLIGYKDYLSRQGGGIGTRGPGEQQVETDRRRITREIRSIEKKLDKMAKNRDEKRKRRRSSKIPLVALVGYSNVGKSTIMNGVIDRFGTNDKKVYQDDRLFATLDTSVRQMKFKNGRSFLMIDTVGFVSDLPTNLLEAFKSTLEEVIYADLVLIVLDSSFPDYMAQLKVTEDTLSDLGQVEADRLIVLNKKDLIDEREIRENIKESIQISAKNPYDIDLLIDRIEEILNGDLNRATLKIPFEESGLIDKIKKIYSIDDLKYEKDGTLIEVRMRGEDLDLYRDYVIR